MHHRDRCRAAVVRLWLLRTMVVSHGFLLRGVTQTRWHRSRRIGDSLCGRGNENSGAHGGLQTIGRMRTQRHLKAASTGSVDLHIQRSQPTGEVYEGPGERRLT
ncbi:hypothetical protein C8Q72DRAFT_94581 [Fomitopsis betulina]|nr:hypothetical protein C8Q72DRAFT_94581 [Fomitopsis betulina]